MNPLSQLFEVGYIMKTPLWLLISTFIFYVGVLGACVFGVINCMWKILDPKYASKSEYKSHRKISAIFGFVERAILFCGFVLNMNILLYGWFAFRFASVWQGWKEKRINGIPGHAIFNINLTGFGLNIFFAILSKLTLIYIPFLIHQFCHENINNFIE